MKDNPTQKTPNNELTFSTVVACQLDAYQFSPTKNKHKIKEGKFS